MKNLESILHGWMNQVCGCLFFAKHSFFIVWSFWKKKKLSLVEAWLLKTSDFPIKSNRLSYLCSLYAGIVNSGNTSNCVST